MLASVRVAGVVFQLLSLLQIPRDGEGDIEEDDTGHKTEADSGNADINIIPRQRIGRGVLASAC